VQRMDQRAIDGAMYHGEIEGAKDQREIAAIEGAMD